MRMANAMPGSIVQEMQKKHEEENPHACRICGKRFPTQVKTFSTL
jgi:ribosomal protein L16/L10AE